MPGPKRASFILVILSLLSLHCGSESVDDGRVTITFWHSFVQSTVPALQELIARFEEEHPGIRIDAQYIPTGEALVQKLVTSVQSKTAPDISWIHSHYLEDLVGADAIYEMKHFTEGPNGLDSLDLADIHPALIEYGSFRGTLYSMPMEATNLGLVYNKDHFREVGLDSDSPPSDWAELLDMSQKLTRDLNGDGKLDRVGFMPAVVPADGPQGPYMMWQWTPFLWQAGGYLINKEQTQVLFDSDAAVMALTLWKDLYEKQRLGQFSNDWMISFASGQASMMLDGPWNLPRYPELLGDIDWGVAMLPAGPAKRATVVAGEYLAIFKQSANPDSAWAFVKWMVDPEVQAFWSMKSGYLPIRGAVMDIDWYRQFLDENPGQKAFVDQMEFAQAQRPMDFSTLKIQRELTIAIERATVGGMDPTTVLREAAQKSNAMLALTNPSVAGTE
ncbi:MAG TPA: ABC transporter substrate-binding protein [Rhodothermia bacterium]|nr:ABC transporter substrate-binding protein [Rhodothermia bacterium]